MAIDNHSEVCAAGVGPVNGEAAASLHANPSQVAAVKKQLQRQLQKSLVKGDTWYLIDAKWNKQLKKYLNIKCYEEEAGDKDDGEGGGTSLEVDASAHPGPIDNQQLLKQGDDSEEPGEIRDHLMDGLDYVVVPEEAWQVLVREFGLTNGQDPIARKVVEHGMFVKHCKVEVYEDDFFLAESEDPKKTVKKKFSKADTIDDIISVMRKLFDINDEVQVRLWVKYSSSTYEKLNNAESTLQDAGLFPGQLIIIEKQAADGTWPRDPATSNDATVNNLSNGDTASMASATTAAAAASSSNNDVEVDDDDLASRPSSSSVATVAASSSNSISSSKSSIVNRRPTTFNNMGSYGGGESPAGCADKTQPGLCGLSNLGNTCFMNSIIQGLSNTPPVIEYFACDNYIEDINEDNPLGMRGEIARAFGELIKSMWSGKYSYVVPRNFKTAVGRFAPQFSGYQQHDSQELLTFLLDGLHEDLNRVKKKPYIEIKDSGGRPDEEVAAEAWQVYKKRNDSVILDLMYGLQKSTVVCPECPKISVTFDPYSCLSLSLPVKKEKHIEVFLVYMPPPPPAEDGAAAATRVPTQFKVTCPESGTMKDLCDGLSKLSGVPSDKMVVTDVYNHRFHKIYAQDENLSQISERDDIFVYEVPTTSRSDPNVVVTPIYLREKKSSMSYSPSNLFGQPLLMGLPRNLNYEELYQHIVSSLSRCITPPPPDAEHQWWKPAAPPATDSNGQVNGVVNGEKEGGAGGDVVVKPADELMIDEDAGIDDEEEDDKKGPPKMFAMNLVNAYGNAQLEELHNDGQPVEIGKHYLSLDWHPKAKELFYNHKAAEDVAQDESYRAKLVQKNQSISLSDCLELYTTKEKLGEKNTWRCPDCKKDQQATKKFDLWSLPAVLVISLKRFSFKRMWRDKLDAKVDFPVYGLDLSPYIINKNHGSAVYDLIAVSNHYGGMGGGHYTAYAKNKDDGKWYYFDDSSVTLSSEDAVVTKAAYVLFYLRRDLSRMSNNNNSSSSNCNGVGAAAAASAGAEASSEEDMDTY